MRFLKTFMISCTTSLIRSLGSRDVLKDEYLRLPRLLLSRILNLEKSSETGYLNKQTKLEQIDIRL